MGQRKIIAWDFDGVLNANIQDGRFLWADRFEDDWGHSLATFQSMVFGADFETILTGKEDLRDRLIKWAAAVGFNGSIDHFIEYWFERDILPDAEILRLSDELGERGARQVMATNNEWRRTAVIENTPAFSTRVERVFAAGPMGVCKPDPAFFEMITAELGVAPDQMILVDDHKANIASARNLGWSAFHFTDSHRGDLAAFLGHALELAA